MALGNMHQYRRFLLYPLLASVLAAATFSTGLRAATPWYPVAVDLWIPPFDNASQAESHQYRPLEESTRQWNICVSIPHLKDAYWLAVNYGLIAEARRLDIALSLYEAGGYEQLGVQRQQLQDCLDKDVDGLIVGAISTNGLDDLVQAAAAREIPVIDMVNGMSSPDISARVAVNFQDMGYQAGAYLRRLHPDGGNRVRVAWFPGPDGAAWVAAADSGFRRAVDGSSIEITSDSKGDTGLATQSRLIEAVLDEHADKLDYIVGTAVTAEAAVTILRRRGLAKKIQVLSFYYSPDIHRGIKRGNILAAPSDQTVLQARIAVDVMVRILEKRDYFKHVGPGVILIDSERLKNWDSSTTLAPRGFRPIFSINN